MTYIGTNVAAIRSTIGIDKATMQQNNGVERLSTGKRINSSKDDAAGLAISSRMTSQVRGLAAAIRNSNDGVSLAQTAEGAMAEVGNMLQRLRELAVQAANGTNSESDGVALQQEVTQLIGRSTISPAKTTFNGINLVDGSATALTIQTGINAGDTVTMAIASLDTTDLGINAIDLSTTAGASAALACLRPRSTPSTPTGQASAPCRTGSKPAFRT